MTKLRCCAPGEPSFPVQTTMGYPQQNGDRVQLPYSLHALLLHLWRGMQVWDCPLEPTIKDRGSQCVPDACFEITWTESVNQRSFLNQY